MKRLYKVNLRNARTQAEYMRESLKVKNLNVLNRTSLSRLGVDTRRLRTGLEESTLSVPDEERHETKRAS